MAIIIKPLPEMTPEEVKRFWSHVRIGGPDECWPWTAYKSPKGYGGFSLRGGGYVASRIALKLATNIDLLNQLACHSCDNPPCCNPNHLRADTQLGNRREAVAKGRTASGDRQGLRKHPEKVARGERASLAKLTWKQIDEIKRRRSQGEIGTSIASDFNVHYSTIYKALKGRTWKEQ